MNTAVNLLPWRAERRQRRWRQSLLALVMSGLAGALLWWRLDAATASRLHLQRQQHQVLVQELAELELQIAAFERHSRQQREQTIAHVQLERERLSFIRLLDALARQTPNGVVLTEVQQQGERLTLTARATTSGQMARTVQQWHRAGAGAPLLLSITSDRQEGTGHTFTLSLPWLGDGEYGQIPLAHAGGGP